MDFGFDQRFFVVVLGFFRLVLYQEKVPCVDVGVGSNLANAVCFAEILAQAGFNLCPALEQHAGFLFLFLSDQVVALLLSQDEDRLLQVEVEVERPHCLGDSEAVFLDNLLYFGEPPGIEEDPEKAQDRCHTAPEAEGRDLLW
ncbi:MAG TPA: hypothetical protein VLQ45_09735 [Thermoanaerobaculia bacterium]|nr:hypothetical protein [Thermoanaerobaculia bacterium]